MHVSPLRSFAFGLALVAATLSAQAARAETSAELIAKNLVARGGSEKLAAISSVQFTGKIISPGDFELAYVETRARKNGEARYESSVQGMTLVQGFDGKIGWRINPFEGRRDAERMSEDDMRALADDATIDGPVLSSKARGSTVTYLGREDFEGTNTYKLRVADPSGVQYMYYLDPDTYLEIKVVETRKIRGARQVTLMEYSDYERVDGVYFPFAIESGAADSTADQRQKLVIDRARANISVDDATFAMPAAPATK
ncbi:MAG: hypothetical protein IAI50_12070 [Candidatus Eremiobacteraeota bacterium]|nr:hypothetical protein [Candidatus Eremiobacteraeota bacterium]